MSLGKQGHPIARPSPASCSHTANAGLQASAACSTTRLQPSALKISLTSNRKPYNG